MNNTNLPAELAEWKVKIEAIAKSYGLDFYPTIFEILDWKQMNMVASYGGFPNRYPHWSFGMEYEQLSKSYSYGLSKIYEMVINNDPSYAYLLHSNSMMDQKLVMAHVYGHVDFFKHNLYFAHTNRKMMDQMANHKTRIKRYIDKHGQDEVERFLDVCLSVDNLIDFHSSFMDRHEVPEENLTPREGEAADSSHVRKLKSKDYMDKFVNPTEFIEAQKKKFQDKLDQEKKFPSKPERDVLHFLLEYAPLEPWKRDILSMIHEEAYYFLPQRQTKIMNEGWASYWHSTMMTQKILDPSEFIDYADHHSGTLASHGRLNPYKLGIELLRDVEDRWNKGKFGKEYDECDDMVAKKNWDLKLGKGREKIFEVRKLHNDLTFIDTFLTPQFCMEQKLFGFDYNKNKNTYEISTRDFQKIKQKLLFQLTNGGQPVISVYDANYKNRGELYLLHHHEGIDLRVDWLQVVLTNLHALWHRPVLIETKLENNDRVYSYNGTEHSDFRKE